jgi:uncharacterized paraquat-inducible protein A
MQNKPIFSCDKCHEKVPLVALIKIKKGSMTICNFCHTLLYPRKTIAFNWAFFIGFILTVLPAEIIFKTSDNMPLAFSAAIIGGVLAVLGIAAYTYLTTEFRS